MLSFSVLSVVPVPDLDLARKDLRLEDLDDESVAKVLFHRRKQASGGVESLRWDQCTFGAVTLIDHGDSSLTISRWSATEHDEVSVLEAIHRTTLGRDYRFSWACEQQMLPLLRFRAVLNDVVMPALWSKDAAPSPAWQDLGDWWSPPSDDRPNLDEVAKALGLPGLLDNDPADATAAWVEGAPQQVDALAILQALNLYLMALRVLHSRSELTKDRLNRAHADVNAWLAAQQDPSLIAFQDAWPGAH